MLELRPSCEHCNRPLPPTASTRICSLNARPALRASTVSSGTCVRTVAAVSSAGRSGPRGTGRATTISARIPRARSQAPVDAQAHARFAAAIRDIRSKTGDELRA
jgi:hypothetical protein